MTAMPRPDPRAQQARLTTEVVLVTPDLAREWLSFNRHNRKVNRRRVARYAADMRQGRWQLTGQGIQFGANGSLLDGQHRLLALIESGISVLMLVVRGVSESAFEALDQGDRRRLSDVLSIRGEQNGTTLAATIGELWRYRHRHQRPAPPLTSSAELELFEEEQELRESVAFVCAHRWHKLATSSTLAICHHLFRAQDPAQAEMFFEQLRTGLDPSSGVAALRNRLTEGQGRLEKDEVLGLFFLAWLAHRAGQPIRCLRLRRNTHGRVILPELE